jgi:hypothetical protein
MSRRLAALLLSALPLAASAADPPKPTGPTVTDATGKDVPLTKWSISTGTRPLQWLATDGKAPEALAFRETNSTTFVDGVFTLIPLDRLESLTYDSDKKSVSAKVAGLEKPLQGSIKYKQVNQVVIEAEVDKGEAGVLAVKYRGGQLQAGIKAVRLPGAKQAPAPTGDKVFVTLAEKGATAEPAYNLKALYRVPDGKEKLSTTLMFKVSFKVDLAQLTRLKLAEDTKSNVIECDVALKDGTEQSLTLLPTIKLDGQDAKLEGFIGEVPAGYKLFPPHCIAEISRTEPKAEPEPKKPDPKKDD